MTKKKKLTTKRVLLRSADGTEQELDQNTRVLFVLATGGEIEVSHSSGQEPNDVLSLYARNGSLSIRPRVDNVVCVDVQDPINVRKPVLRLK